MHKRVILALVLVFALMMSTSCSLIIKDEAVDMATPVIEVAGQTVTKGEVKSLIEDIHDYNEQMYSYYGMAYDRTSDSAIADAKEQAIQGLIESIVVDAKMTEYGFDSFTEEEMAEIEATAKEDYDLYYDTIKNFYFSGTELTGEELEAAIQAEMLNMVGYNTLENAVEQIKYTKSQEKLVAELNKDVAVSEEELTTEYNARVDSAKASYTAAAYTYGTAIVNGEMPYYAPEGYRNVKHILLQFTAEDQTAISEIETAIANLAAGEDATELNDKLAAAREQAYANLQPKVDEITAKLAEGIDFETLIAEYNEDPGMNGETEGYPVCSTSVDWVVEFKDASMALANVGDVSGAVRSEYGIHFIKYQSDIASGEIGLETVREALTAELLSAKESSNVDTILAQWVEEANAKVNEKELNK
ncbi:MAG: peptidylprolyl isomerase [Clostridia bacterium]|nr:peptidylprolyl isomerase [Clostridia bacterium]